MPGLNEDITAMSVNVNMKHIKHIYTEYNRRDRIQMFYQKITIIQGYQQITHTKTETQCL